MGVFSQEDVLNHERKIMKEKTSQKKSSKQRIHKNRNARSKRYTSLVSQIDREKQYSLQDALELVKKTSTTTFDASVEVHIHLGTDRSRSDQTVRGAVVYPHSTGKQPRIAAFVPQDKKQESQDAGATLVGGEELVEEIQKTSKCDFDIAIATPDMMRFLGKIGKTLGQKGLMPNPKTETITPNPGVTIKELLSGKVSFKSDDTGNIHQVIGKVSHDVKDLSENYTTLMDALSKARPEGFKGILVRQVSLSSSMGPSIKVATSA